MQYDFSCGCSVDIIDNDVYHNGLPSMRLDYYNLNKQCPITWDVFGQGRTKGIFQLEKGLGKKWSKEMKPVCIEEVAALVSILRPGCLKAIVDGQSMTKHFIERKNGNEEYTNIHPLANTVLDQTYGVNVYQEQSLALAKIFAGYDLVQADILRRAIGKKKADIMQECRVSFVDGCEKTGIISGDDAVALFDIIEKSNRYAFNKAHAVEYAETAYWCAYAKAHFPLQFFCSWLTFSKNKDDILELYNDSKYYNIEIMTPSLFSKNKSFEIENGKIRFGLGKIKSIGESKVMKLLNIVSQIEEERQEKISNMSWIEILTKLLPRLEKGVVNNLISCGALSNKYGMTRTSMLFEYNKIKTLNNNEMLLIKNENFKNVTELFEWLHVHTKPARKNIVHSNYLLIKDNPESLSDTSDWIANVEGDLLGVSITCSKLDSCDIGAVNCTCAEFATTDLKSIVMAVQLDRVSEWRAKTENARPMGFITAHDKTGSLDMSIGSNEYEEYNFLLFTGNTVAISGVKNKNGGLSIKKVVQI